MTLRMILLIAAMRLVASGRSYPVVALLVGAATLGILVRDWLEFRAGAVERGEGSFRGAIGGATLCLVGIGLTTPGVSSVRIPLILLAGGFGMWAAVWFAHYRNRAVERSVADEPRR